MDKAYLVIRPFLTSTLSSANSDSLDYGKTIEVTVVSVGLDAQQKFQVDENVLFHFSPHIKSRMSQQRSKSKYEICKTDPADFKVFLDWAYHQALSRTAAREHLESLLSIQLDRDDFLIATVVRLRRLLRMTALYIDSSALRLQLAHLLNKRAQEVFPGQVKLSMDEGNVLWRDCFKIEGPWPSNHMVDTLRTCIPAWMAPSLTREEIEKPGHGLSPELLEALRKLLPFTMVTVMTTSSEQVHSVTVNRQLACARSKTIFEALAAARPNLPAFGVVLDDLGTLRLTEDHPPGVLENWAETLTSRGNELRYFRMHYFNIKEDVEQATALKTGLCDLWILAETFQDTMLQKAIMSALIKYHNRPVYRGAPLDWTIVHRVIEKVLPDHGLRLWLVDVLAVDIVRGLAKPTAENCPPEMLKELLIRVQEMHGDNTEQESPSAADIAKYC